MRIGITVDEGVRPTGAGVRTYIRNLVRSLLEIDRVNEYLLIYARTGEKPVFPVALGERVQIVEIPIERRLLQRGLWFPFGWPLVERFTGPLDLLHHTGTASAVPTRVPLVITVYDLFPELYPQHFAWTGRLWRRRLITQMRNMARYLISISEATKKDAMRLLGLPSQHIVVTPLALSPEFRAPQSVEIDPILAQYGVLRPYFLFIGRIDPRKNLLNLLAAFRWFIHTTNYPHRLVVVGALGTRADRVLAEARALELDGRVLFLGYLPTDHIVALMRAADVFVYPSRYEGFGFPLLEAMACDTPIAASNVSSIPEVAGPAANYFDPYDPADICRALVELVEDASLRATLIEEGHRRLVDFSWERTARQTLEIYYRVAGGR